MKSARQFTVTMQRHCIQWRFVELFLLLAIALTLWRAYGTHLSSAVSAQLANIREQRAAQPLGGAVAADSQNPFVTFSYYWNQLDDAAPQLLPDIVPIIGDDTPWQNNYPGLHRWLIDTTSRPGRILLRINTLTANMGDGPLHIVGGSVNEDGQQAVYQRIWRADNSFVDQRAGYFVYHPDHDHIHFDNYAQYVLRLHDETGRIVAGGRKVGFCLTDVLPIDKELMASSAVKLTLTAWECGSREQGINAGYSDYYGAALADQWIDVTDLPWGTYTLQIVVDPQNLILESNEENNRVTVTIEYTEEASYERAFEKYFSRSSQ